MLIGPNGTGKSSIFDALLAWAGQRGAGGVGWEPTFYVKKAATLAVSDFSILLDRVDLHEANRPATQEEWKKLFYVRSAYRNEPEVRVGNLGDIPEPGTRQFNRTIENDQSVSTNYRRIVMGTIRDIFASNGPNRTLLVGDYADRVIKDEI